MVPVIIMAGGLLTSDAIRPCFLTTNKTTNLPNDDLVTAQGIKISSETTKDNDVKMLSLKSKRQNHENPYPLNAKTVEDELNLALVGTVTGKGVKPAAIFVNNKESKQILSHCGDIINGAKVKDILKKKVILEYHGGEISLSLSGLSIDDQDTSRQAPLALQQEEFTSENPPAADAENIERKKDDREIEYEQEDSVTVATLTLNRTEFEDLTINADNFLNYTSLSPYSEDGQPVGVMFSHIKPNSFFDVIGLQDEDVLVKVNEQDIRELESATVMGLHLRDARSMLIKVIRGDKLETIKFNIQ